MSLDCGLTVLRHRAVGAGKRREVAADRLDK